MLLLHLPKIFSGCFWRLHPRQFLWLLGFAFQKPTKNTAKCLKTPIRRSKRTQNQPILATSGGSTEQKPRCLAALDHGNIIEVAGEYSLPISLDPADAGRTIAIGKLFSFVSSMKNTFWEKKRLKLFPTVFWLYLVVYAVVLFLSGNELVLYDLFVLLAYDFEVVGTSCSKKRS